MWQAQRAFKMFLCAWLTGGRPWLHPSLFVPSLQQRCMYCIKGAFTDMQQDLSPLSQLVAAQAGRGGQQGALERELAAGRDVARALTAADREQQQRVEANVRHVLRQVSCRPGQAWGMFNTGGGQASDPMLLRIAESYDLLLSLACVSDRCGSSHPTRCVLPAWTCAVSAPRAHCAAGGGKRCRSGRCCFAAAKWATHGRHERGGSASRSDSGRRNHRAAATAIGCG